ncbi:MAG: hypothetical protein RLZZ507_4276 [Cyanobacteriota bacterium]|jgi:hypothetical protein
MFTVFYLTNPYVNGALLSLAIALRRKTFWFTVYAIALQEYLQSHKPDQITQQLDAVYADEDSSIDPLFVSLQAHTISTV